MTRTRSTHTVAELEVCAETFREIHDLLMKADYQHAMVRHDDGRVMIDMTGIGLVELASVAPRRGRRTFVLAGTSTQYREYLAEHRIPHGSAAVRMLTTVDQLRGAQEFDLVRVGTWKALDPAFLREVDQTERAYQGRR